MSKADHRFNVGGTIFFAFLTGYFTRAEYAALPPEWQTGFWLVAVMANFLAMLMFVVPLLRNGRDEPRRNTKT